MLFEKLVVVRDFSPFKRGILLFDDYNYKSINNNILPTIEELIEAEGDESDFSSIRDSNNEEDDFELDQDYLMLKAEKKRIKKIEKERMLNKLGESNDSPFTVKEVNEIHHMQQDDPFIDVLNIRNDAKLDYLNLADKIDIRNHITELADRKKQQKAVTIASSSRKEDETEIGLFQKQTKLNLIDKNEDGESGEDSNKMYQDDPNIDHMTSLK